MSVFTCLEVPYLDETWHAATPNPGGILSWNPLPGMKPSCSVSIISSKRPGWSFQTSMINVYVLHACSSVVCMCVICYATESAQQ